ncbi:MAG: hypothetical protein CMG39_00980 [Candidatus Marinimicrobia bacterium]|nr:hypothetical protein [Candidatus Neomarinimicrobiota bacterium]
MLFFLNSLIFSLSVEDIESLYLSDDIIGAQSMLELVEDKNEQYHYLSYQIYLKLDDLNNANKSLQAAVKQNPDKYSDEGIQLGELINDLKNVSKTLSSGFVLEAIEETEALLEKYKDNSIVYYRLGFAHKENKDYENAVLNFNKARELNPYNSLYKDEIENIAKIEILKGKEAYDVKDYQTALEYFNKALSYDPENTSAMFRIGNIYYAIKDYEKAAEILERGIELQPKNYKVLYMIAKCYIAIDDSDKALSFLDKAIFVKSDYTKAIFEKAKVYKSKGDLDKTKSILNDIITLDEGYYRAYELLMDLEIGSSNLDQAISYANKALNASPDAFSILARLASVYNEKLDYNKARDNAKLSLKNKRNYAPALFELGVAEMNLCNKLAAKDAFNKCKRDRNYRKTANNYLKPENFDYYTKHCSE